MAMMLESWFMNLGPYSAGAAAAVFFATMPLPEIVLRAVNTVPPAVWYAGAGYAVSPPGRDQGAAALKGIAGGVGATYILTRVL